MARKRINAEILLGCAILLLVAGAAGALLRPPMEPDRTIESRFGDVIWNHEQHARMEAIVSCQVCHHQDRPGVTEPRACRSCHKANDAFEEMVQADLFLVRDKPEYKDDFGPPPYIAFHGKCVGCHKAMKKGPVLCRDCHQPITSGAHGLVQWDHRTHSRKLGMDENGVPVESNCVECHHQDKDATNDGEYRGCRSCHEPASVMGLTVSTGMVGIDGVKEIEKHKNAKHGECAKCHTEKDPEDDLRSCKDCHKPWTYDAAKKERPSIEQALHANCLRCHNEEYAKVTESMPVTCEDCHKPDPSWLASPENGHVLWNHRRHGMYRGMSCEECHHQDIPGEPHMACRKCHSTGLYDNPSLAEAFKKRCIGCHQEKKTGLESWDRLATEKASLEFHRIESEKGSFSFDHRSHAIADSFACQECHHNILRKDGVYVTSLRAKKEWTEEASRIQSCRNCHGVAGPVAGSIAEGTDAMAFEKVLEKACVECHQRLGGGPQTWDGFFVEPKINWDDAVKAKTTEIKAEEGAS